MSVIDTFIALCNKATIKDASVDDIDNLQHFLGRLVASGQTLELSEPVRKVIPGLANIQSGNFIPLLSKTIEGLSPMHFVPDLNLETALRPHPPSARRSTRSRRSAKSARLNRSKFDMNSVDDYQRGRPSFIPHEPTTGKKITNSAI